MSLSVKNISRVSFGQSDRQNDSKQGPSAAKIAAETVAAGGAGAGLGYWNYANSSAANSEKKFKKVFSFAEDMKNSILNSTFKSSDEAFAKGLKNGLAQVIVEGGSGVNTLAAYFSRELGASEKTQQPLIEKINTIAKPWFEKIQAVIKPLEEDIKAYGEAKANLGTAEYELKNLNLIQASQDLIEAATNEVERCREALKDVLYSESLSEKAPGVADKFVEAVDSGFKSAKDSLSKKFNAAKKSFIGIGAVTALGLYGGARYLIAQSKKEN
ncbi:MAG: hypothetical protein LBK53_06935 [Heliobacteriaceae bacterium]|jgi:hypothetical protein|nr:hypothetical protein [Heliobacteriaceae bacterium]